MVIDKNEKKSLLIDSTRQFNYGTELKNYWHAHRLDMGLGIYDTARVARIFSKKDEPQFPQLIKLILKLINDDGSVCIESNQWQHNLISALSITNTLLLMGNKIYSKKISNLLKYMVKNIHKIACENQIDISNSDILFSHELILLKQQLTTRSLLTMEEIKHITIQLNSLHETAIKRIGSYKNDALGLCTQGRQSLYSIEGFPDRLLDLEILKKLFNKQSGIMTSPSATAKYYELTEDPMALKYLYEVSSANTEGGMQCLFPFTFQEISWVLSYAIKSKLNIEDYFENEINELKHNLTNEGIGASNGLPRDADDTSMSLYVLNHTMNNRPTQNAYILEKWWNEDYQAYETFGGSFRTRPDVSTNTHVLAAYLADKTIQDQQKIKVSRRVISFLRQKAQTTADESSALFWNDKWNISPFYPALEIIDTLLTLNNQYPEIESLDLLNGAINWILNNQCRNGGFISQTSYGATVEETSYGVLALKLCLNTSNNYNMDKNRIIAAVNKGLDFLQKNDTENHPPLWVAKGLYSPRNVIKSLVLAARHL